jgi:cyclophilin family peptidyl-prolyl cis-trans isomerase
MFDKERLALKSKAVLSVLSLVSAGLLLASCGRKGARKTDLKPAPDEYKVVLQTTKGDVNILVHRNWSPLGADHFYQLVNMGFYNGDRFFRIVPDFVVQFGMNGDPALNKQWSEANITDDPVKVSNKQGTVVFAKTSEPNTRSTQIFINLGDNSRLDAQGFSPFGEVIQGMDNVEAFYKDYGESPDQGQIGEKGNAYLEQSFPKLDYIKKAYIVK